MSAIVAIPARLNSTRFPRKVLMDIQGHPMLWHVCEAVSQAKSIDEVWVLTDSEEVVEASRTWGVKVLMTSEDCPSGTDRVASVIDRLPGEIIVNVQGDEPLIQGAVVDQLVEALNPSPADVSTPIYPITDLEDLTNPNVVKVVRARDGSALYFSRSPIPHVRNVMQRDWPTHFSFWGHAGVYAYRRDVLTEYSRLPKGSLEFAEMLEQLRLLEAGQRILTVEIAYRPQAVDVPADLEAVKEILGAAGGQL